MVTSDELEILKLKRGKGQRVRYEKKANVVKTTDDGYDKLSPMQQKFVDTYIITQDKRMAMQEAGYSDKTCPTNVLNKPKVKSVVEKKREELWDRFKDYAELALQVQVDMLTNPTVSNKVKLDATNSILDRAGYKATERREIVGAIGHIAVESKAVSEMANRARELLKNRGLIDDEQIDEAEIIDVTEV